MASHRNSKKLLVFASELAALIGRNRYREQEAAFRTLYSRQSGRSVASFSSHEDTLQAATAREHTVLTLKDLEDDVLEETATSVPVDAEKYGEKRSLWQEAKRVESEAAQSVEQAIERGAPEEEVQHLTQQAEQAKLSTRLQREEVVEVIVEAAVDKTAQTFETTTELDQAMSDMQLSPQVEETVQAAVRTERGTLQEGTILQRLEKALDTKIARPTHAFYRALSTHELTQQTTCNWPYSVALYGRVDGTSKDGQHVVEIKNRRNRLFDDIPEYELIQLHVYLYTTRTHTAIWCQNLDGELNVREVDFEPSYWNFITAELGKALHDYENWRREQGLLLPGEQEIQEMVE
ncbi:MAG: hypothetical protein MHM6MM_002963 [Cercozoa sp. M6MM]